MGSSCAAAWLAGMQDLTLCSMIPVSVRLPSACRLPSVLDIATRKNEQIHHNKKVVMMRVGRKFLSVAVTAAMMGIAASSAALACTPQDIVGRWQATSFSYERGFEPFWTVCDITIQPDGRYSPGSVCTNSLNQTSLASGAVVMVDGPLCVFRGNISLFGRFSEISRLVMNASKDHVDGVGRFANGVFFFNLAKPGP